MRLIVGVAPDGIDINCFGCDKLILPGSRRMGVSLFVDDVTRLRWYHKWFPFRSILIFSVDECLPDDIVKVPENEYVDIEGLRYSLEDLRYSFGLSKLIIRFDIEDATTPGIKPSRIM